MKLKRRFSNDSKNHDHTLKVGDYVVLDDEMGARGVWLSSRNLSVTESREKRLRLDIKLVFGIWRISKIVDRQNKHPLATVEIVNADGNVIETMEVDLYWCHRATKEVIEYITKECRNEMEIYRICAEQMKRIDDANKSVEGCLFV